MRALVTGASQGIGAATAERLARDGWEVALHGFHHAVELQTLAGRLGGGRSGTFPVIADLAEPDAPAAIARQLRARWDSLDLLVHNAGVYPRSAFARITDEELETCLRVNLTGPFRLTRELLPLLSRSTSGRIVFVSSILAFTGSKHASHYATAKAGLLGLARSLAIELAPAITVNVVAPGSIDTAILADDTPSMRDQRSRAIPLGRVGNASEVADAIAFLASPGASYITGATLHVNGGLRLE
jgi:3-oxoacyl-[acyl-carrier protein] reductase